MPTAAAAAVAAVAAVVAAVAAVAAVVAVVAVVQRDFWLKIYKNLKRAISQVLVQL